MSNIFNIRKEAVSLSISNNPHFWMIVIKIRISDFIHQNAGTFTNTKIWIVVCYIWMSFCSEWLWLHSEWSYKFGLLFLLDLKPVLLSHKRYMNYKYIFVTCESSLWCNCAQYSWFVTKHKFWLTWNTCSVLWMEKKGTLTIILGWKQAWTYTIRLNWEKLNSCLVNIM